MDSLLPEKPAPGIEAEISASLLSAPRRIPSKYFYDEHGSRLYEAICATPEYYPARTETALLESCASTVIERAQPRTVIELGSGSSRKTWPLLRACERQNAFVCYMPIDVCGEMLTHAAGELVARFDWLTIRAVKGDYAAGLAHLPSTRGPRLFLFLGGTIGNLTETETQAFLADLRLVMEPGDWLLLGADRVKPADVLNAAYNDAQGYTAAFNRNILRVLNRELHADFDPDGFAHEAGYHESAARIEMYLRARRAQRVHLRRLDTELVIARNESILTEISRKFTPESLRSSLHSAGFSIIEHYEPRNRYFSLLLCAPYVSD